LLQDSQDKPFSGDASSNGSQFLQANRVHFVVPATVWIDHASLSGGAECICVTAVTQKPIVGSAPAVCSFLLMKIES
jgi:hypothetical protein